MDPQAAYNNWIIAVLQENLEESVEAYDALHQWLQRGGFEPNWGPNGRKQFYTFNRDTGRLDLVKALYT